tara:strand:+ start:127 stop:636 length:510 start_codon:yes stop_codon:yes gene_type:complete
MNRKNQNKRREFLNNVCPTVAMAFLGVSLLESCSSGDDDVDVGGGGNNGGGTDNGYSKSGNNIIINLNHSNFSKLQSDGWQNFYQEKVLILKISSTSYRAFEGRCPHQGVHTAWSYNSSTNQFRCGQHTNDYETDCSTPSVNPNSGKEFGSLKCFSNSLNGNSLTITKS